MTEVIPNEDQKLRKKRLSMAIEEAIKWWDRIMQITGDMKEVWKEWFTNLSNTPVCDFHWIKLAFQSTKDWWTIWKHKHRSDTDWDETDELIILIDWENYWNIWTHEHETENWIMRIPEWKEHWWESNWTWVSLKPSSYTFEWSKNWVYVYNEWNKRMWIQRISGIWNWLKFSNIWYNWNILLVRLWSQEIFHSEVNSNSEVPDNWDYLIIWELKQE